MKKIPELTLDDLKEQHKEYAEILGVQNLLLFSKQYGGTSIYIPKIEELLKSQRDVAIIEEYNGKNVKNLARKYDVSERTIYRLVGGMLKTVRNQPLNQQIQLFDEKIST